ncbi:MAG: BglII/BstYI family type II restriction endonuclease [Armatimonadota bacterium]|nr:BglII/BstYI family type II restriction endonuclease [Armatimonadota bacterium]
MIKVFEYSHLGGSEILQLRYPEINAQIDEVIGTVQLPKKTKVSKEKTRPGRLLYSPVELNRKFREEFHRRDFRELRDTFDITIPGYPLTIRNAFKQIDFVRADVLVEVQFGKYAFMFYDLAKFQYFFNEQKAQVGIEIVPTHGLKKQMSSGVSFGEQLIHDIERLRRHFPAVPVKVILVDVEGARTGVEEAAETIADQEADHVGR